MTLTNKYGLPTALVEAIKRHSHKGAKYSISMLCQSPRQVWLKKRHEGEVIEDARDRIWAALGTAFHNLMHDHAGPNELSEEYMDEIVPGLPVSGTLDVFVASGKLTDYKTTSIWSIIYDSKTEEWTAQINGYALGLHYRGFEVTEAETTVLLRDWREGESHRMANYPECQVMTVPIKLWTHEQQEAFVRERVRIFNLYENTPDDKLPLCTDADRWQRDSKGPKRCDLYCDACPFCNQRQDELKERALLKGERK